MAARNLWLRFCLICLVTSYAGGQMLVYNGKRAEYEQDEPLSSTQQGLSSLAPDVATGPTTIAQPSTHVVESASTSLSSIPGTHSTSSATTLIPVTVNAPSIGVVSALPTTVSTTTPSPSPANGGGGGLSESARIGLGVGLGVGISLFLAIIVVVWFCTRKRRTQPQPRPGKTIEPEEEHASKSGPEPVVTAARRSTPAEMSFREDATVPQLTVQAAYYEPPGEHLDFRTPPEEPESHGQDGLFDSSVHVHRHMLSPSYGQEAAETPSASPVSPVSPMSPISPEDGRGMNLR